MLREVLIENFKSIQALNLQLGRVNAFIGANGSGKSNILEAIALESAAAQDRLSNEFLASRGIRVTDPQFMRAAFDLERAAGKTYIQVKLENGITLQHYIWTEESAAYAQWQHEDGWRIPRELRGIDVDLEKMVREISAITPPVSNTLRAAIQRAFLLEEGVLPDFLIFSPETSYLRVFQAEGQILPLGIKGEGLFAHLKALSARFQDRLAEIRHRLTMIDWFEHFEIPNDLAPGERSIRIRDRYLAEGALFDQRSANEGFLFLLFYMTLFVSPDTPGFFAIDNIDASLNPKLCAALVRELVELSNKHDKQVILTTHNPAALDGLDLTDDEQRLFVIDRNKDGHTSARRISPPKPLDGEPPMKLSEAFMRGYIGGLPKNF